MLSTDPSNKDICIVKNTFKNNFHLLLKKEPSKFNNSVKSIYIYIYIYIYIQVYYFSNLPENTFLRKKNLLQINSL